MTRLQPSSVVGPWIVGGLMGRGDISEVYEARDDKGEVVALKLLTLDLSRAGLSWQNFEREAKAFAHASHGMAAAIDSVGVDPTTHLPYIVRERIPQESLYAEVLRSGPIAVPRVAAILQGLAPGLDAAHAQGLGHRGLKPQNLFATMAGLGEPVTVRLTDSSTYIVRGAMPTGAGWSGTPGWIGPDAADASAVSTARMDVFSLGLICFFALTGRPFFKTLSRPQIVFEELWNEMIQPVQSASQQARDVGSGLGSALDGWFAQALAPHPRGRFGSVSDMANQFAARAGGPIARAPAPAPRGPARAAATQMGIGPLAGLGAGGAGEARPGAVRVPSTHPPPPDPPPAGGQKRAFGGGTLMMQFGVTPDAQTPPPPPAGTGFGATLPLAPPPAAASDSIGPAATVSSDQGPVALASGQPLAYMHDLPPPAAAMPEAPTSAYGARPSAVSVPGKRSMLVPLLLLGGGVLLLFAAIGAWLVFSGDPADGAESEPAASADVASASPVPAAVSSTPDPVAAANSASPATEAAEVVVSLACDPECDSIECDGAVIEPRNARLTPGRHECRFQKRGFIARTEVFNIAAGEEQKHRIALKRVPAAEPRAVSKPPRQTAKKQPCGTFINPCK
ncbi:MAG TPA: serine/threonine-protein kinase [Polyangiaceae bacterium]|nr:serine/threonine-protein kinase [Polyangiaceae bacterium]